MPSRTAPTAQKLLDVSWQRFAYLESELDRIAAFILQQEGAPLIDACAGLVHPLVKIDGIERAWRFPRPCTPYGLARRLCEDLAPSVGVPPSLLAIFAASGLLVRSSRELLAAIQRRDEPLSIYNVLALPPGTLRQVASCMVECNSRLELELQEANRRIPWNFESCAEGPHTAPEDTKYASMLRVVHRPHEYEMELGQDLDGLTEQEVCQALQENIQYRFGLPCDCQALCDDSGPLISPVDFVRALRRDDPRIEVFDTRTSQQMDSLRFRRVDKLRDSIMREQLIHVSPERADPQVALRHAESWVARQEYRRALEWLDQALRTDPCHVRMLQFRGCCLREMGRHGEALQSLEHALSVEPRAADVLRDRGHVLVVLGRFADAIQELDKSLTFKIDASALCLRGLAHLRLGHLRECMTDFDMALALRPGDPLCLRHLGSAKMALGLYAKALNDFEMALKSVPNDFCILNLASTARELLTRRQPRVSVTAVDPVAQEGAPRSDPARAVERDVLEQFTRSDQARARLPPFFF